MLTIETITERVMNLKVDSESSETPDLDFSWTNLDDVQTEQLAKLLLAHPSITKINLYGNNIGSVGAIALSKVPSLKEVVLSGNPIGSDGVVALARSAISVLKIRNIENLDTQAINALVASDCLKTLDVGECGLGDEQAKMLLCSKSIQELILDTNGLSEVAVSEIADNTWLHSLYIAQNYLGNKGAESIAGNKCLQTVDLSSNRIGDTGALAFEGSSTINLNLSQNNISGLGFSALCRSSTLENISLFGASLNFDGLAGLPENNHLRTINLSSNSIKDKPSFQPLLDLVSFSSLENLILADNKIGSERVKELYQKASPSLHELDLSGNPIETTLITPGYCLKRSSKMIADDQPVQENQKKPKKMSS